MEEVATDTLQEETTLSEPAKSGDNYLSFLEEKNLTEDQVRSAYLEYEQKTKPEFTDADLDERNLEPFARSERGGELLGIMRDVTGEGDYVDADDNFGRYVESSLSTSQDKMQGALPEISWSGENRKDVLLARSEEVVVPELNQRFGQYGFSFEETGVGDAIIAYAPDIKDKEGNIIEKGATKEFNLDAWFDSSNVEETEALKKWMYENKPKQEEIDAIEEKDSHLRCRRYER